MLGDFVSFPKQLSGFCFLCGVYACSFVCMHTHVCAHVHVCILGHMRAHTFVHVRVHVCIHVHLCIRVHVCLHARVCEMLMFDVLLHCSVSPMITFRLFLVIFDNFTYIHNISWS